jgi:hypothetical protein
MTQREKKLAFGGLGAVVLLGSVFFFVNAIWEPLQKRNRAINTIQNEIDLKMGELALRRADAREFQRLKALSLPADPNPDHRPFDLAWGEYDKYLRGLLRSSRLQDVRVSGTPPAIKAAVTPQEKNKKSLYTPLLFSVEARGEVAGVVDLLNRFYHTPLLHQVKTLTARPIKADPAKNIGERQVEIKMSVEALLVEGAQKRLELLPGERRLLAIHALTALRGGPAGLALVPLSLDPTLLNPVPLSATASSGRYEYISQKNIFHPPPVKPPPPVEEVGPYSDVNINEYVRLTSIVRKGGRWEAFLFNVFDNKSTRLWATDRRALWVKRQDINRDFRNITIWDADRQPKTAHVVRIDHRDVYFAYDGYYYAVHLGETLANAFDNKALSAERIKELGLPEQPESAGSGDPRRAQPEKEKKEDGR